MVHSISKIDRVLGEDSLAKYLDTGSNNSSHSLGYWLDTNLVSGIQEFHAQFAYFTYTALKPYADTLKAAVLAGFPVHIVLGSNEKSLVVGDLRQVLKIVENAASASLTVVAYSNAKFHPKTVQVVRSDGSSTAVVGSGNLTHRGLGWNVEAGITLDSAEGDDVTIIRQVADATDRWHSLTESGVFPIQNEADINALLSAGVLSIILPPQQPSTSLVAKVGTKTKTVLGSRRPLWRPKVTGAVSTAVPAKSTAQRKSQAATKSVNSTTLSAILPPQQWYKQMSKSDAQQVKVGTNPTGKLRLTKGKFPIDVSIFFRNDLFGLSSWQTITRRKKLYNVAEIDFAVQILGKSYGIVTLKVDHALHRISNQKNIPTVLAWGPELEPLLVATSYTGNWVVIERNEQGAFSLTIQSARP